MRVRAGGTLFVSVWKSLVWCAWRIYHRTPMPPMPDRLTLWRLQARTLRVTSMWPYPRSQYDSVHLYRADHFLKVWSTLEGHISPNISGDLRMKNSSLRLCTPLRIQVRVHPWCAYRGGPKLFNAGVCLTRLWMGFHFLVSEGCKSIPRALEQN